LVAVVRVPPVTTLDPPAAREHVEREYARILDAIESCADAVAASWDGNSTTDASALSDHLEAALRESDVLDALPGVLEAAVAAAGGELQADPVAAPPYVVVTSRGPVLRATLPAGRLVVTLAAFRVTDDRRYVRTDVGVDIRVSWTGARA
jgi:hypothetical protein